MLLEDTLKRYRKTGICLDGGPIHLRPLTLQDADDITAMAKDFRVAETTTRLPHPYRFEHATLWIAAQEKQRLTYSALHWAIVEKVTLRVVGVISLDIDLRDRSAQLGYWLGHAHWGRGWGTQAAKIVTRWSIDSGFEKLAARCLSWNKASIKILERCGFSPEGLLRSHVRRQSVRHDVLCFGLLPSDFAKGLISSPIRGFADSDG